jgi:SAM-dependent methyltransferase
MSTTPSVYRQPVYRRLAMTDYVLAQEGAEESERERLSLLEQVWDPHTARQLDAIGVGEGWRCLDVGAGAGSVTRLLAERAGETGSVLAVDLDTRLLEVDARVEVRRQDFLADPLPQATFDLVHARNLLVHLPSRVDSLRRLLSAVRPGGWLALGEPDFTVQALSPPSDVWRRVWAAFCDAAVSGGWDPGYGARLISDLEAVGVVELEADTVIRHTPGGSVHARLFAGTLERLTERMLSLGATADDLAEAQRLLRDPGVTYCGVGITMAWARRPD